MDVCLCVCVCVCLYHHPGSDDRPGKAYLKNFILVLFDMGCVHVLGSTIWVPMHVFV